jgi:hypothetical protein
LADLAQQLELHRLGVVLGVVRGIASVDAVEEFGLRALRERSAMACSAREARTSLRISLLMPCM